MNEMSPARWQKIRSVFTSALEKETGQRDAFLEEECGADESLKATVKELLASHNEQDDFLEKFSFPNEESSVVEIDLISGSQIGPYKIVRQIGRGGMGTVYLANRTDEVYEKEVAIKIVKRGMDSEMLSRFRRERKILAQLNHPNIARLLDGGTTESGLPYLVMDYVDGSTVDEYCDAKRLSTIDRLKLFRTICSAVHYAHQNLVIHRDIKARNILVTSDGSAKLLDFGIAKVIQPDPLPAHANTATALPIMTPEYASPEQIRGEPVTTATDIYSLGVVLYELLTGHRPYRIETFTDFQKVLSQEQPSKPSSMVLRTEEITTEGGAIRILPQQVAEARSEALSKLKNRLDGDLDNIVLKALNKVPSRRYASVEQFSEDIDRYLQGLPVSARKDSLRYRAGKFISRNKAGVAAAALILLALISGLVVSLWEAGVARRQRDLAHQEKHKAERISEFLSAALAYSDPTSAVPGAKNRRDATINQMLDDLAPRIQTELADQPDVRASLQRTIGSAYLSQTRISEAARYLDSALQTDLAIYGENHPETAYTYSAMGSMMELKGDLAAAENFFGKSVAILRRQEPKEQIQIKALASVLTELGDVFWTKGDLKAADLADSESLTMALRMQPPDPEVIAAAKRSLGVTRYAQGRFDEAAKLLREVVSEYRSRPNMRWRLPDALNFLGQTLIWKNQFGNQNGLQEAIDYLKESEAISLSVWGENNFWYPRSLWLQIYAMCFKNQKECAAAEGILEKAEEINNRYFPDNKVTRANLLDARNIMLTRTDRIAEGEKFGRQAVQLYQESLNRGSPNITLARLHLAENLIAQKEYQEARRILQEAYKDAAEIQGADHWRTKEVANRLSQLKQLQ